MVLLLDLYERTGKKAYLDAVGKALPYYKRSLLPDGLGESSPLAKVDRSLDHVFTMLSLVLDPDAVQLSLHAVLSGDRNLRGDRTGGRSVGCAGCFLERQDVSNSGARTWCFSEFAKHTCHQPYQRRCRRTS